jgi:hypothetical protein
MRLLWVQADDSLSLLNYVGEPVPLYAIISHTWGADDDEVVFKVMRKASDNVETKHHKSSFCGR